jgi:two-component system sensor histidine kinase and response regulator WspE
MRILLIDDSDIALEMMSSLLTAQGHQVFRSSSPIGVSAIIFRRQIDVVVVDLELTSFRGERLVDLFRKHPRLAKLGVVLISGQPLADIEAVARECGADAAASKMELKMLPGAVRRAYVARGGSP